MSSQDTPRNTVDLNSKPKLQNLFRLQWEEAQNRWVLLYPEGMVQLNTSAAEILRLCDGERSVAQIINELETKFNAQNLSADVSALLAEAGRRHWVKDL